MSAYEGKENYIFISYSHKDSDVVLPLIEAIQKAGFRVWFDGRIEPGSEWPEYIETHLMGSACVLAFISPSSVESPFCRKEIGLAISHNDSNDKDKKHIDFLSVYLEKTELKYGLGLLIGNSQSLFRYNYNSDAEFLTEILTAPKLQSCKIGSEVDTSVANDVKLPSRSTTNDNPLLKRAYMFIEDKDWSNADAYLEKVLDSDPENAEAYLGKLMADFKITNPNMLFWLLDEVVKTPNFNKFLRFARDEEKLFVAEEAMFSLYNFAKNIAYDESKYDRLPEAIKALDDIKQYFNLLLNREEAYKESKLFDKITFQSLDDLAGKVEAAAGEKILAKSTLSRVLNNAEYNNYFTYDRGRKEIILKNNFRSKPGEAEKQLFVILSAAEILYLVRSQDSLLIQYYFYLRYSCGLSKSKTTDSTAK